MEAKRAIGILALSLTLLIPVFGQGEHKDGCAPKNWSRSRIRWPGI